MNDRLLITDRKPFCQVGTGELFAVCTGIQARSALEEASCLLAASICVIQQTADESCTDTAHGAAYLVEAAKAVVDSVLSNMSRPSDISTLMD